MTQRTQQLELFLSISSIANEAETLQEAVQKTLEQICLHFSWPVGHAYLVDNTNPDLLVSSVFWYLKNPESFQNFIQITERMSFKEGIGLPGRVLAQKKSVWISDVAIDSNFPRNKVALDLGVHSAFACPVFSRGKLVAVLEFFSEKIIPENSSLLALSEHAAKQLGPAFERENSENKIKELNQKLSRDLEQFAYVASHHLQEPLRMISSYLQLLEKRYKDTLDTNAHDYITFAVDGSQRMKQLILDLLEYTDVSTHPKEQTVADSGTALKQALHKLENAIIQTKAQITYDSLPTVTANESQLERLFQNLVGNALKYRDPNITPAIHISAQKTDSAWKFSIQDNGIGISGEYFDKIFLIFHRLHGNSEYSGTGLGLSVCEKIIQHHGGKIWVESEPSKGSNFQFTLRHPFVK